MIKFFSNSQQTMAYVAEDIDIIIEDLKYAIEDLLDNPYCEKTARRARSLIKTEDK